VSRVSARHSPSRERDTGVLLKRANPFRMNFDGTKLLCGFDCNRVATQMVKRLRDNSEGKPVEVMIPWCGSC
jgi:hypothetical protein